MISGILKKEHQFLCCLLSLCGCFGCNFRSRKGTCIDVHFLSQYWVNSVCVRRQSNLILRIGQVKLALNSVFGTRGKGTNGASARVLKNNFYFDDVTKNKVFLSNIKTHIGRVPDGEIFWQLAHGWAFSFSRCKAKNNQIYTYFSVIRLKNENCEFLQKLCTDFLVAVSVETPWMFTLLSLKQRQFTV